jgi:hypothetical protein
MAGDYVQWMTAIFVAETLTAEIAPCIAVAQHRSHGLTRSLTAPEPRLVCRWIDRDVYQTSAGRVSAAAWPRIFRAQKGPFGADYHHLG